MQISEEVLNNMIKLLYPTGRVSYLLRQFGAVKSVIKQQQLKFTRRFISASSMLTITSVDRCATDLIISKHTLPVLAAI